jgi:DNA repair protein RadC
MTSLKHWPKGSRPQERLFQHRPASLSVPELLSILIRTGNAQANAVELAMRILDHFHHKMDKLFNASVIELMKIKGIGKAKAAAIAAAFELGRRVRNAPPPERYFIRDSRASVDFIRSLLGHPEPGLSGALYLVQAGWVIDAGTFILKNPMSQTPDLKQLLQKALEVMAVSIITFEIYPSGTLWPTHECQNRITTIRQTAAKIDIKLLDHLLLNNESYFSFADTGLI